MSDDPALRILGYFVAIVVAGHIVVGAVALLGFAAPSARGFSRRGLRVVQWVWTAAVLLVMVLDIASRWQQAPNPMEGWNDIARMYAPFNIIGWLGILFSVSPALLAGWLHERLQEAA